jgi:hypothetical protein
MRRQATCFVTARLNLGVGGGGVGHGSGTPSRAVSVGEIADATGENGWFVFGFASGFVSGFVVSAKPRAVPALQVRGCVGLRSMEPTNAQHSRSHAFPRRSLPGSLPACRPSPYLGDSGLLSFVGGRLVTLTPGRPPGTQRIVNTPVSGQPGKGSGATPLGPTGGSVTPGRGDRT